jgi:hypothetical protein
MRNLYAEAFRGILALRPREVKEIHGFFEPNGPAGTLWHFPFQKRTIGAFPPHTLESDVAGTPANRRLK